MSSAKLHTKGGAVQNRCAAAWKGETAIAKGCTVGICAFFEAKFNLLFILVGDNTRKEECDTLLSLLKRYIHLN
jgi:hypothetical protein